ncbi:hypothetical protein Hanom_Chr12g01127861 [Helianthus anomalus]
MAPRRAVNAHDQPPPPPLSRTTKELNSLLEERISEAIAQYEANRTEQSGGPSNTRRNRNGDSYGGNTSHGCTFKKFLDCKPLNYEDTGGAVAFVRWKEKTNSTIRMSKFQTLGDDDAYGMTWDELKERMREKYCSRTELQRLEIEFWHLTMEGADITGYT